VTTSDDGRVRVEVGDGGAVWRVVLDRPAKLNALDEATRGALHAVLADVAERDEVRVVVLAGAGRAFSAGADLADRPASRDGPDGAADGAAGAADGAAGADGGVVARRATGRWQRLLDDLERLPQATVVRLQGHVIGGGALLAAACDLRVAADDLALRIPEVALGLPLTWAGLPRLAREVGLSRTRDLVMTGRLLGAAEALDWGLVHRVAPVDHLDAAVDELVATLVAQPALALARTVDGLRALGRALSAPDTAWADPDLLLTSLTSPPRRDRP
jgi:enoyl-CoA hydratase/carnithine racemase